MNGSFSSDTSRTEAVGVDLLAAGTFPPLVEAFLRGKHLDLLDPVRLWAADEMSEGGCAETAPDRRAVAEALRAANAEAGHAAADRLAERLADPATRVVITGQQPGFLGGPLYTLSKAVAAQLWAERLNAAGEPAVALFWIATEDHDFLESSRAAVLAPPGVVRVDLGEDTEPLVPVGARRLGAPVDEALEELVRAVPGDRYHAWVDQLRQWYRPDARFGEAFAGLLAHLLGDRCPLLVDAMLPELKQAQRPWLRQVVDQRQALAEAFAERDNEILERRFSHQVKPQPGTSPLFLEHAGQRRRIEWREQNRFGLRGDEEFEDSVDRLLEIIDTEPSRVSPGVRARSAIQDAVFGTCLQILGPGELAYLPQAAPLFELLAIPAPIVALRPQVLVLDRRQLEKLEETNVPLAVLLKPDVDLDDLLARPEETAFVAAAADGLDDLLADLGRAALALDANLESPLEKTRKQIRKALGAFEERVKAAAARRDEVTRNRLEGLRGACLPEGRLQERVVASAHFPGKYSRAFVDAMFEQMDLEPTNLNLISP